MTRAYALAVHIDSSEYDGSYYLLGDEHETPAAVLVNVAADHILAMTPGGAGLCQHALNLLEAGVTVSESEFTDAEVRTRCELYANPDYSQFSFSFDDSTYPITLRRPDSADIEAVTANFEEYANPDDGFDQGGQPIEDSADSEDD